jgi:hypothetical protein
LKVTHGRFGILFQDDIRGVGDPAPFFSRDPSLPRSNPRVGHRIGEVGCTLGEHFGRPIDVLEDVRNRILVFVAEQLGQALGEPLDPVD